MSLNLWDSQDCADYFMKLKSKLLEGLIAEHLFTTDVLPRNHSYLSKGWWGCRHPRKWKNFLLFHLITSPPNELDFPIYEALIQKNISVYLVYYTQHNTICFLSLNDHLEELEKGNSKPFFMNTGAFLQSLRITRKLEDVDFTTKEEMIDEKISKKAIAYMEKEGILSELAIEDYFSKCILQTYLAKYAFNIDGLYLYQGQLRVMEIKFKYPTPSQEFGINVGATNFFRWLFLRGIEVYHAVLVNGLNNTKISVLDVIGKEQVKKKCFWVLGHLTDDNISKEKKKAPKKTQLHGKNEQWFYPISVRHFKKVKGVKYLIN